MQYGLLRNTRINMMDLNWYDLVGTAGVTAIIVSYLLLQLDRMRSDSLAYSAMNAAGASCIVLSLLYEFNLSAFIVESFWAAISLVGVARWVVRKRKRGRGESGQTPRV
jgi:hypothetical protein